MFSRVVVSKTRSCLRLRGYASISGVSTTPKPIQSPEIKYSGIFYNNDFHKSKSGETFDTINPATGKVTTSIEKSGIEDVNAAVQAAKDAFRLGSPWRTTDASQRGYLLHKLADLMARDADYLASLETLDVGKPFVIAHQVDVVTCVKILRFYAGLADKNFGKTIAIDGDYIAHTRHEPVGVCGQIIPWNFPMVMFVMKIAPALAAGNTVIVKPAEQSPLTALYIAQLVKEVGIPEGVVNVVPGYGDAGEALVRHPNVDKIAFTGSSVVGKKIQQMSGLVNLKRTTLELGGKSPNIVLSDVDIPAAVEHAHQALFFNAGQVCVAASRTYIEENIYDEFVERSVERAKQRVVGDPFNMQTEQGPQVDGKQMSKILEMIESGVKDGATLAVGGQRHGDVGYFVQPTVFYNVQDNHRIARDEIFGPVQQLIKFKNLDEIIERANNTNYGLAAAVFSKDIDKVNYLVQGIRAGAVFVNCYGVIAPQVPFGGYKDSGLGRENGEEGITQYTEVKSVITSVHKKNS